MPTPEDNPRGTPLNASPSPRHTPVTPLCLVIDYRGGFVPGDDGEVTLPTCLLPVGHDGPHSGEDEPTPKPRSRTDEVLAATREILNFLETIAGNDTRFWFLPGAVLAALPTIR